MPSYRTHSVLVAGYARSGSTLLGAALGSAPGMVFVGEASRLPRQIRKGSNCSCGDELVHCKFWEPVVHAMDRSQNDWRQLE